MNTNKALHKAKKVVNNEYYTLYEDIEREVSHYKEYLRDKIVYLNCDSMTSQFYHYFQNNFNELGLKGLIRTSLDDGISFNSDKAIEKLKYCDVVITNPPFSLLREYVELLMKYDKKFLIVSNINSYTYKSIFKHIKEHTIWNGHTFPYWFRIPNDRLITTKYSKLDADGNPLVHLGNGTWLTNLGDYPDRPFIVNNLLYEVDKYDRFQDTGYINVNKVTEIPDDYNGVMGVPVTFLHKYNPNQFTILGTSTFYEIDGVKPNVFLENGKEPFKRLWIRRIID